MGRILDIVNAAIFEVGGSPITQEEYDNDKTKAAIAVSGNYLRVKRSVLFHYPWRIAERQIRLEPETLTEAEADARYGITLAGAVSYTGPSFRLFLKSVTDGIGTYYTAPVAQYTRQFLLPEYMVRIRLVSDSSGMLVDSTVRGEYVLANDSEVYLTYTEDLDEADIDETLGSVIALSLAATIAPYMGEDERQPYLKQQALTAWRLAKNADAQQSPNRVFQSVDWLEGRLYGSSNPYPFILQ